jgi:hypothetical protein
MLGVVPSVEAAALVGAQLVGGCLAFAMVRLLYPVPASRHLSLDPQKSP